VFYCGASNASVRRGENPRVG
jgi:hypothetical protein